MSLRKRWMLVVVCSLFFSTVFSAYFSHRSESKVDQFVVPVPFGGGSVVVDSYLGWLNIYRLKYFRSEKPRTMLEGLPVKHPSVVAFRESLFQNRLRPDHSYEWKSLRNVSFLVAALGFAICLILLLVDIRSSRQE